MKHTLASDTINMSTDHDGFKMLKRKLGWPKHMGNKLLTLEREIMPTNKARSPTHGQILGSNVYMIVTCAMYIFLHHKRYLLFFQMPLRRQ